jgi:hypothetical protein
MEKILRTVRCSISRQKEKGNTHFGSKDHPATVGLPRLGGALVSKFKACSSLVVDERNSDSIVGDVKNLESLFDIEKLMEILSLLEKR